MSFYCEKILRQINGKALRLVIPTVAEMERLFWPEILILK